VPKSGDAEHGSASELLADWRSQSEVVRAGGERQASRPDNPAEVVKVHPTGLSQGGHRGARGRGVDADG
jgi:hypothetical protein